MTRIVAIGECMVEMAPGEHTGDYRMGFAGDTLNTAWYLRQRLPHSDQVDYLSAVGEDAISGQMLAFLEQAGIGSAHIARRADRTVGLYLISLRDGERYFSYWRSQSAARTLAQDATVLEQALRGARMAYFSGITLAILPEEDRQRLLQALQGVRRTGGQVAFDPNLRPRLWASTAQMTTAVMQAAAVSDIVLPSYEDEQNWFGDADPGVTAQRYAGCGAGTVIVKNGAGSIRSSVAGVTATHPPVAVPQVIDTTAAGDSFNAAYLAGHLAGQPTDQSVQAAAGLAAQVVQARGALVSGCH